MEKCKRNGVELTPCKFLKKAIAGDYNEGRKGISELYVLSDSRFVLKHIALKSGEYKKKGIVIPFCPFCGENIQFKESAHE
jgi:hypothetical protein